MDRLPGTVALGIFLTLSAACAAETLWSTGGSSSAPIPLRLANPSWDGHDSALAGRSVDIGSVCQFRLNCLSSNWGDTRNPSFAPVLSFREITATPSHF